MPDHPAASAPAPATLASIRDSLLFFDDWEDRYRFIIDIGRDLPPMPAADKTETNIVHGCQSQVWITSSLRDGRLQFRLDSDALIVRGLIAIVLAAYNNKTAAEILAFDINALFNELDLLRHLSPTRGNGLTALVRRIRSIATARAATEAG